MPSVCLDSFDGPFFIVKAKTGVTYLNTVGGFACNEMRCEGFLIPCKIAGKFIVRDNLYMFDKEWWSRAYKSKEFPNFSAISDDIERFYNEDRLIWSEGVSNLKVKKFIKEAEVEVTLDFIDLLDMGASVSYDAILTWRNCD